VVSCVRHCKLLSRRPPDETFWLHVVILESFSSAIPHFRSLSLYCVEFPWNTTGLHGGFICFLPTKNYHGKKFSMTISWIISHRIQWSRHGKRYTWQFHHSGENMKTPWKPVVFCGNSMEIFRWNSMKYITGTSKMQDCLLILYAAMYQDDECCVCWMCRGHRREDRRARAGGAAQERTEGQQGGCRLPDSVARRV